MYVTSCDVKATSIPIPPDSVVYTNDSDPPGIKVAFCREVTISPRWKFITMSACIRKKPKGYKSDIAYWSNECFNFTNIHIKLPAIDHERTTFCDAPFSSPLSHNALFPVGSSSTSSLTSPGSLIYHNKQISFVIQWCQQNYSLPNPNHFWVWIDIKLV